MKQYFLTLLLATATLFISGCSEEEATTPIAGAKPKVSMVTPSGSTALTPEVGSTVDFTLYIEAEAGLSSFRVDGKSVKSYSGTEKSDSVKYSLLISKADPFTVGFSVEDAMGEVISLDPVQVNPVKGIDLGYLLVDFSGEALGAGETVTIPEGDTRVRTKFANAGETGASVTVEEVAGQMQYFFAQANPDPTDKTKVFKVVKEPRNPEENWGGWANLFFSFEAPISSEQIAALPQYDTIAKVTTAGKKVIQLDVYYDDTQTSYKWADMLKTTEVWNSDPSKGYKVDMMLVNYAINAQQAWTYDRGNGGQGFHIGYTAYITEPNKWVTLTFDMIDEGGLGHYDLTGLDATSAKADQVDAINILPAPGYAKDDLNPLYIKNLRIVDVK